MKLRKQHKHIRDRYAREHPDYANNHIYLIHGKSHLEKGYKSVTTFIKKFFHDFDADAIIEQYYDNWQKRKHSEYFEKTPDEIKEMWDKKRDDAARDGTYMHTQFENYDNGLDFDDTIPEFETFKRWRDSFKIIPYRTEMTVYSPKYKLVGNVDLIAINEHGELIIVDYKRMEKPNDSSFGKKCKGGLQLEHTDNTKHMLQLNIYKHILEKHYGFKIKGLYNLYIKDDSYELVRRPTFSNMDKLLRGD